MPSKVPITLACGDYEIVRALKEGEVQPDRIVIDIDPGRAVGWPAVVDAARAVRELLRALELESFVKTTGGRGLHVVVPLVPRADWTECLDFARAIAETLERRDPARFTTRFAKLERDDKILIDYLRNNRTNTSIAAFSTRARANAPTWVYQLDWRSPLDGGKWRAPHTLDIPLAFDNTGVASALSGDDAQARQMASLVSQAFIQFAKSGNPNTPGLPSWPEYRLERRSTMVFDLPAAVVDDPRGAERRLFATAPYVQPGS